VFSFDVCPIRRIGDNVFIPKIPPCTDKETEPVVGELDFCELLRTGASNDKTALSEPGCPEVVTVTIRLLRREARILHVSEVCENQMLFSALLCPVRADNVFVCVAKPLPVIVKSLAGGIAKFDTPPDEIMGIS